METLDPMTENTLPPRSKGAFDRHTYWDIILCRLVESLHYGTRKCNQK